MHFVALYTYQLDYIQELVPPASLQARLLGLTSLRIPACNSTVPTEADIRVLQFRSLHWTLYVSPLVLLSFYFTVATVTRLQLLQQLLLDNDHVGRSYQSMAVKESVEPSASGVWTSLEGTVVSGGGVPSAGGASIAAGCGAEDDTVAGSMPDRGPGSRQLLLLMVLQGCRLLTRGSYVVTLIMMMAWSITYHSWLTFVLLLWSCVLWMMPSSRLACLRSSPALVAYAELLLLLQYLYSLDLTDEELPQQVNAVNLAQVGLFKYGYNSYQPLAVKTSLCTKTRPLPLSNDTIVNTQMVHVGNAASQQGPRAALRVGRAMSSPQRQHSTGGAFAAASGCTWELSARALDPYWHGRRAACAAPPPDTHVKGRLPTQRSS
ncbi:hypothetical protein HPB50_017600 [Hyalomma asiaticum]|uniref:Uncharacterized protein n=1 Tax=Hyalomma asiaticum TaxID=266040 RepID=A0ACB7TQT0_HYAAI|nr:hypothetical protein HPB50_017600 [Hyalomma asiaticum]